VKSTVSNRVRCRRTCRAGIRLECRALDFYAGNHKPLFKDLTKAEFTYQLSDHLPLWVQINTDTDDQKLEQLIQG